LIWVRREDAPELRDGVDLTRRFGTKGPEEDWMSKKLLRNKAEALLREHGEMDTTQLRDHLNKRLKHGTTVSELGNILGKYSEFVKVRKETRISCAGRSSGSYKVCVWALK